MLFWIDFIVLCSLSFLAVVWSLKTLVDMMKLLDRRPYEVKCLSCNKTEDFNQLATALVRDGWVPCGIAHSTAGAGIIRQIFTRTEKNAKKYGNSHWDTVDK